MSDKQKSAIGLPAEQAESTDAKVAFGTYASASEVVRAGLRALQERDAVVDRWLREEVAPTYDAMKANPERATPVAQAFDAVRARHCARVRGCR